LSPHATNNASDPTAASETHTLRIFTSKLSFRVSGAVLRYRRHDRAQ
jgi:hypothetical protein